MRFLKLLPRHGVWLDVDTTRKDQGERFVRLFRETWSQIHLGDRRIMLKFWRTRRELYENEDELHEDGFPVLMIPTIAICDIRNSWADGNEDLLAVAQVQTTPTLINVSFWAAHFEWLPDEHAKTLIAHELAHCLCYADGSKSHAPNVNRLGEKTALDYAWDEAEMEAHEVMFSWGFHQCDMDDWVKENDSTAPRHPLLETD